MLYTVCCMLYEYIYADMLYTAAVGGKMQKLRSLARHLGRIGAFLFGDRFRLRARGLHGDIAYVTVRTTD